MLSSITRHFSDRSSTKEDMYRYGQTFEVEIEVSFRKTYKAKAWNKEEASEKINQKVSKQNKTLRKQNGLNFVSSKTVRCKPLPEAK